MPVPTLPAPMDLPNEARINNHGNTPATPVGPFVRGHKLYCFCYVYISTFATEMLSSTDGITWTANDTANEPPTIGGAGYFDGASTCRFIYPTGSNTITYQEFDFSSDTWGSPATYGGTGPTDVSVVYSAYFRAGDSAIVLIYENTSGGLAYSIVDNTGTFAVTSVTIDSDPTADAFGCMDPASGDVWGFYENFITDGQNYFVVRADNSLTGPATILTDSNLYWGTPVIVGDAIVVPTIAGPLLGPPPSFNPVAGGIYIGTPLSAPVFTLYPPDETEGGLFPNADAADLFQEAVSSPQLFASSSVLYAIGVLGSRDTGENQFILQVSKAIPGNPLVWKDKTFYTSTPADTFYQTLIRPTINVLDGQLMITCDGNDADGNEIAYSFTPFPLGVFNEFD